MSEIFNAAYVIVAVVLLFGAAVFVHEFGHFWMARRRGLKVEAFAIDRSQDSQLDARRH